MRQNRKFILFVHALESFFTTWALMKAARRTASVISILFTIMYLLVDFTKYVENLTNPLFIFIIFFAVFVGFYLLFYHLLLFLFSYTANKPVLSRYLFTKEGNPLLTIERTIQKRAGLYSFLCCLICWLPYFLYEYPGIMTPDSINQFEQVLSLIPLSNHHPVAHTMTIGLFFHIGLLFTDSPLIAISFYTVFQMVFMAFCISYLVGTLKRFQVRPLFYALITLFYALVPYHAVYSVTIWKDILFAGAVLLFGCTMLRLTLQINWGRLVLFILSGIMICLFRSNGWYGFLVCLPFLLYDYRKKMLVFYPALLGIFLTAALIRYPIMNHAGVVQPDFIESCSIPTQQIAAVICNDRELTDEQLSLITKVIDLTYIKDLYNPTYADNMKELVRAGDQAYLISHKKEFFQLWFSLFLKYPGDYLQAYADQTYGYWYPDCFYPVAEADGVSGTSLGVSHTPLIRGPIVIKGKEIALKLGNMVPLYSLLFSMGVIFWILIFCIGNAFVRKEKTKLIYYLPSLALYLTVMIATPVATEFRYVYFMIFSLPLYLMLMVLPSVSCSPAESDLADHNDHLPIE